jgi:RNA polymerase sigma-70 factor (ECF subfamily)
MEINKLAASAKNGSQEAFEQLYNCFSQRIFYQIRKKIQHRQDAEDVLQEIFIKSYKGLSSLRPGKIYFSAWLYKITNNTINDYLRKKYRRPEIISIDEGFDPPDNKSLYKEIMLKSDLETARENLDSLPAQHKQVLELRLFRQFSVEEAAAALNKSSLAIRMLQYRARKKLKFISEKTASMVNAS